MVVESKPCKGAITLETFHNIIPYCALTGLRTLTFYFPGLHPGLIYVALTGLLVTSLWRFKSTTWCMSKKRCVLTLAFSNGGGYSRLLLSKLNSIDNHPRSISCFASKSNVPSLKRRGRYSITKTNINHFSQPRQSTKKRLRCFGIKLECRSSYCFVSSQSGPANLSALRVSIHPLYKRFLSMTGLGKKRLAT